MPKASGIGSDFDPHLACSALLGLTEAIYHQVTEGEASERPMSRQTHSALIGLSWLARRVARELNAYFDGLSEAGIELPDRSALEKGVHDARGLYLAKK